MGRAGSMALPDDGTAHKAGVGRRAAVRVLPDDEARRIPREAAAGSTPWPAWTWQAYDAFRLADAARAAFAAISPKVQHTLLPSMCMVPAQALWAHEMLHGVRIRWRFSLDQGNLTSADPAAFGQCPPCLCGSGF
jgi:hypothetical protein